MSWISQDLKVATYHFLLVMCLPGCEGAFDGSQWNTQEHVAFSSQGQCDLEAGLGHKKGVYPIPCFLNFPAPFLCLLSVKQPSPPVPKPWAGHLHTLFQCCDSQLWEQPPFPSLESCRLADLLNICSCSSTAGEWCSDPRGVWGACSELPECFHDVFWWGTPSLNATFPLLLPLALLHAPPYPSCLQEFSLCTSWLLLAGASLKLS